MTAAAVGPTRRDAGARMAPFVLLGVALIGAFALVNTAPQLFSAAAIPWFLPLSALAAGVRAWGSAGSGGSAAGDAPRRARERVAFWSGLAVTLALVLLNPAFGLYAFIFYPDGTRLLRWREATLGLVMVAVVCALAQAGGPRSPTFTPLLLALFLLVNLVVAGSMAVFDRQRQRTSEALARANASLRAEQARNAALQDQLLSQARDAGVTQERARLAREIHDTIAQDLVAIIAQLSAANQPARTDLPESAERRRRLDLAEQTARQALAEARRSVRALSSPRLDNDDLPNAVQRLLDAWQESTGATARLATRGDAAGSADTETVALRVIQEALANAARHADAGRVDVTLTYEADTLQVEIVDDGSGFDVDDLEQAPPATGCRGCAPASATPAGSCASTQRPAAARA